MIEIKKKINCVFEAAEYLCRRGSGKSICTKLFEAKRDCGNMTNIPLALFEGAEKLEAILDERVPKNETTELYFSPLYPDVTGTGDVISLGRLLLSCPDEAPNDYTIDDLINFYEKASLDDRVQKYVAVMTVGCGTGQACSAHNMEEYVKEISEFFSDAETKWNLIDIVVNPIPHIKRIMPLIQTTAQLIAENEPLYADIVCCTERVCSQGNIIERLKEMNIVLPKDIDDVVVYPSLFLFNAVFVAFPQEGPIRVYFGVFVDYVFKIRNMKNSAQVYAGTMKVLSDKNRLETLRALRDSVSYGQELAERFDITRNAMYYHLDKLVQLGFVDCTITDYKTFYTMNKANVYSFIERVRQFLLGDWKPQ